MKNENVEQQARIHKLELENLELRWSQRMHNDLVKFAYRDDGTQGLNEMERLLENQAATVFSGGAARSPLDASRSPSPANIVSSRSADVAEAEAREREEKMIEKTLRAQRESDKSLKRSEKRDSSESGGEADSEEIPPHLEPAFKQPPEEQPRVSFHDRPRSAHQESFKNEKEWDNARKPRARPISAEVPSSRSSSRREDRDGRRPGQENNFKMDISEDDNGGGDSFRDARDQLEVGGGEAKRDSHRRPYKRASNYRARYQGRRMRHQENGEGKVQALDEIPRKGERFRPPQHKEGFGFGVQGKSYADQAKEKDMKRELQKERLAKLNKRMGRR
mmetsp:Transcript_35333/g.91873  ORF Transcript_35333/g.91873 Transcript_35333/m.91873 type:complete len:334 (-) Transcript_35333:148-1149(-)